MKKISKILLAVLFVFSTGIAKADFVDTTLAKEVAKNYLVFSTKATSNVVLTLEHTEYLNNVPVYYVFNIDNICCCELL